MQAAIPHVPYRSRKWAIPYHQSYQRWAVKVLHRRAGKTTSDLNQLLRAATNDKWERGRLLYLARQGGFSDKMSAPYIQDLLRGRQYAYVLPTRVHAKQVAWKPLKHYAGYVPNHKTNESELTVSFANGTSVGLYGGDEPDKLRGPAFSGIVFDEFGLHQPNIFSEVISKNLADHLGWATFSGTIKGKNQLYRYWKAAQGNPEWWSIWQDVNVSLATEEDAAILMLRQAMIDDQKLVAQGLMSQEEYDQEWFLSTEAAIKGSYFAKAIALMYREKRVRRVPWDPALPVYDVWDLGKGPNMSVGLFQRVMREIHMIEYVQGSESDGIEQMVALLQQDHRRQYVYGKHFAPHDIKGTEISSGKTRKATAAGFGWHFEVVKDLSVIDGINAARLAFARLYVDETHCAEFLETIGHYRRPWNETLGVFGDNPVHDFASHPADMWRYTAVAEDQMTNEKPKAKMKPAGSVTITGGENAALGWMG